LATVDAAGHAYPAAQSPLHVATLRPWVLPNLPAAQSTQVLAADVDEYRPTAHSVHDPAQQPMAEWSGHKGYKFMTPHLHDKRRHSRLQHRVQSQAHSPSSAYQPVPAGAVENRPATQSEHAVAPATANRPDAHMAAGGLATVDAAGHAYPAAQSPLHVATLRPWVLPNLPAAQTTQVLAADAEEYRPTAHNVHDAVQQPMAQWGGYTYLRTMTPLLRASTHASDRLRSQHGRSRTITRAQSRISPTARTCRRTGELTRHTVRARRRTGRRIPPRCTHGGGWVGHRRRRWACISRGAVTTARRHTRASTAAELACPTFTNTHSITKRKLHEIRKSRTYAHQTNHRSQSATRGFPLRKENKPAGQSTQTPTPTKLYRPGGQMLPAALDTVDAAGHAYPAAQSPLHVDTAKPCVLPNLPTGQSAQLLAAVVDEYRPAAHRVHDPAQKTKSTQGSG
jgi:hypothetical protein